MTRLAPSFLICSERSGSNLVRSILNAHPQVYAPEPIHLGAFWERLAAFGSLDDDRRWRALLEAIVEFLRGWKGTLGPGLTFDVDGLQAAVRPRTFVAIYEHLYARGVAASGKPRLFIKENHTAQRAALLLAAYPDASFVYQVRDPRDYLASCKQMPAYKYGSAAAAVAVWCADQRAALGLAARLPATQLLAGRYEDLLDDPQAYLSQVCALLGLPYAAQMLEFHKTVDAQRAATHAAWRNLGRPIISTNRGRWADQLTPDEVALVEGHAGELMRELGYTPGPGPWPARDPGELDAFGSDPHLHLHRHPVEADGSSGSASVHRVIDRWACGPDHTDPVGR